MDELDPAVAARRQHIEDGGVEDEGAMHALGETQRVMERGMVETAQVAAKPDKG